MLSDLLKDTSLFFGIATTCGGDAIRELLETPGISSHLLEVQIPYATPAMREYLQCDIEQACSEQTARLLAAKAYARAKQILLRSSFHMENLDVPVLGIGVTASLASLRTKQGDHRIHAASVSNHEVHTFQLILNKNTRTRAEEDLFAAEIIRLVIAVGGGKVPGIDDILNTHNLLNIDHNLNMNEKESVASTSPASTLFSSLFPRFRTLNPSEQIAHHTCHASSDWISLWQQKKPFLAGQIVQGRWEELSVPSATSIDTQNLHPQNGSFPQLIFPGSYHPLHQGHQEMLRYAENMFKIPGWYECSLGNVDKPSLDYMEVSNRLKIFPDGSRILLTQLPTFEEKSKTFPGAIFIIGADTLIRLADSKYYAFDEKRRLEALQRIAEQKCRFLVFGRTTSVPPIKLKQATLDNEKQDLQEVKKFVTLQDIVIPSILEKICIFVSESEFRNDISSTEIRRSHT